MRAIFRSVGGCLGVILVIALGLVALQAFELGGDALTAPWAYAIFGYPTLTGHWAGTFTTTSGIKFALYLQLERATASSSEAQAIEYINGRADWCDNQGRHMENVTLSGNVPSFSGYAGSADKVSIHLDEGSSPPLGLLPNNFHGKWDGDTLTFISDFSYNTGNGFQYSDSNPDQSHPVTLSLKRAEIETFRSACAQFG